MNDRRHYINRWKTDYDFKTIVSSFGSLAVTMIFALYNGFLGVYHRSLWHGTICVYYIILVLLRGLIIAAEKKISPQIKGGEARNRVYLIASVLLLILNTSLVVPIAIMVKQQKPVDLTLIPAIAMAVYTTYKIIMASINLKRRSRSGNVLVRLLRTINFVDALVSIITLQNTLIMVNAKGQDTKMITLSAFTSGAIWAAVLALSVTALVNGIRRSRGGK